MVKLEYEREKDEAISEFLIEYRLCEASVKSDLNYLISRDRPAVTMSIANLIMSAGLVIMFAIYYSLPPDLFSLYFDKPFSMGMTTKSYMAIVTALIQGLFVYSAVFTISAWNVSRMIKRCSERIQFLKSLYKTSAGMVGTLTEDEKELKGLIEAIEPTDLLHMEDTLNKLADPYEKYKGPLAYIKRS